MKHTDGFNFKNDLIYLHININLTQLQTHNTEN